MRTLPIREGMPEDRVKMFLQHWMADTVTRFHQPAQRRLPWRTAAAVFQRLASSRALLESVLDGADPPTLGRSFFNQAAQSSCGRNPLSAEQHGANRLWSPFLMGLRVIGATPHRVLALVGERPGRGPHTATLVLSGHHANLLSHLHWDLDALLHRIEAIELTMVPIRLSADMKTIESRTVTTVYDSGNAIEGTAAGAACSAAGGDLGDQHRSRTNMQQCMVCLELFQQGEELRVLPCFHYFHRVCIDQWLCRVAECPVCKHDIVYGSGSGSGRERHAGHMRVAFSTIDLVAQ